MPPIKVNFEIPYFTVSGLQVWRHAGKGAEGGREQRRRLRRGRQVAAAARGLPRALKPKRLGPRRCTRLSASPSAARAQAILALRPPLLVCRLCRSFVPRARARSARQVRYLKVIEKSGYQALPWVRYITTAGNYEIRF